MNEPAILMGDEPTGNLDSKTSREIIALFRDLNEKSGITVILVTHDLNVAKNAKRIVVLRDGGIVSDTRDFAEAAKVLQAGLLEYPRVRLDRSSMTIRDVPVCPHERYVDDLRQNPHLVGNEQTGAALCASCHSLLGEVPRVNGRDLGPHPWGTRFAARSLWGIGRAKLLLSRDLKRTLLPRIRIGRSLAFPTWRFLSIWMAVLVLGLGSPAQAQRRVGTILPSVALSISARPASCRAIRCRLPICPRRSRARSRTCRSNHWRSTVPFAARCGIWMWFAY